MSYPEIIILTNLAIFSALFVGLLVRRRRPRVTTITRSRGSSAALTHSTHSDEAEK